MLTAYKRLINVNYVFTLSLLWSILELSLRILSFVTRVDEFQMLLYLSRLNLETDKLRQINSIM